MLELFAGAAALVLAKSERMHTKPLRGKWTHAAVYVCIAVALRMLSRAMCRGVEPTSRSGHVQVTLRSSRCARNRSLACILCRQGRATCRKRGTSAVINGTYKPLVTVCACNWHSSVVVLQKSYQMKPLHGKSHALCTGQHPSAPAPAMPHQPNSCGTASLRCQHSTHREDGARSLYSRRPGASRPCGAHVELST